MLTGLKKVNICFVYYAFSYLNQRQMAC